MIEDAHRKRRIERAAGVREFLQPQWQDRNREVRPMRRHREELHDIQERRIDTEYGGSAGVRHAQGVIAVATTDIEHAPSCQRFDCALDALPFQVAAPLRIDVHAAHVERSFTPRRQLQQQHAPLGVARCGRQSVDRFLPACKIAVRRCRHAFSRQRLQWLEPVPEPESFEHAGEGNVVGHAHRIAMMETKLK